jgi:alginate production protein
VALLPLAPGLPRAAASAADAFDPEAAPETPYRLAPGLGFGAELQLDFALRRDADLDRRRDDERALLAPELSLALAYAPVPAFEAFVNLALLREFALAAGPEGAGESGDIEVELKEAFVRWGSLGDGPSIVVGRQRFEDEREWLYDEELDAVRLQYGRGPLGAELSVSRNGLARKDLLSEREQERTDNYVLHARYALPREIVVEGYVILRHDRDADRRRPLFLGVRSFGEPVEGLDYWLELAHVGGRDGASRVRGWAVDAGATYELGAFLRPSLTLGAALGSGDPHPDGTDGNFRQTGLQENEGDFGGAAGFKYYGEVLDPELGNLAVLTAGVGIRPAETVSLDLVYHYYLQHRRAPELREAAITAEPSGRSRRLGSEVDLVLGLESVWDRLDVKAVLGYFAPGPAFADGSDGAWLVAAEVQVRF